MSTKTKTTKPKLTLATSDLKRLEALEKANAELEKRLDAVELDLEVLWEKADRANV